jgi:hypothetical protein
MIKVVPTSQAEEYNSANYSETSKYDSRLELFEWLKKYVFKRIKN